MRALALCLVLVAAGCGGGPVCETPEEVLAGGTEGLMCADADGVQAYIEAVAGRGVSRSDVLQLRRGLAKRYKRDAAATMAQVGTAQARLERLSATKGVDAAELRSTWAYEAATGQGAIPGGGDRVDGVRDRAIAVWAHDDDERLALTEVDIEGWVFYASLCREVQDASPIKLSVADRVAVYRIVTDRYEAGSRREQVALASFGAFWPGVQEAWTMASYEQQQGWVREAPLPPPMVATSKGYLATLIDGDVATHAAVLHEHLGPLPLSVLR